MTTGLGGVAFLLGVGCLRCMSPASARLFIVEVGSSAGFNDNHISIGLRLGACQQNLW